MNIVDVEQVLGQHGDGGDPLRMRRLMALQPRPDPYAALPCQPVGTIHASAERIGNADPQNVVAMYRAFLNDALSLQAHIAITPEYSVPWTLISEVAQGGLRPPQGALWVLGCESITPGELEAQKDAFSGNADVRLIYEPFDPQRRAQAVFVDPAVFIFWATDNAGVDVLCLLVQFKTIHSRDPDHVELKSLYRGDNVYKFTSQPGDISLLALICSDAFEFTDALVDSHGANLLIIHLQLNQRPGHIDYAAYRTRLFSVASRANVEVICLNWAANVAIENCAGPWNSISGSAWYVSPHGVAPTDDDINRLHHQGLYYSIVGQRWHAFYLNYEPHSVLVRKRPVFAAGPQVLAPTISPEVVSRRIWESQKGAWTTIPAKDGFAEFIDDYGNLKAMLQQLCEQNPLAVERALELLEGPTGLSSKWYTLKELDALKVAEEESIQCVTVSQETDPARKGVAFRRRRARIAHTAATIPGQPLTWPASVEDLSTGFRYRWIEGEPHSNVEPHAGGESAALVYLGEDPERDTLSTVYGKLSKARKIHAFYACTYAGVDPKDPVTLAEDRLCVVYRENGVLRIYRPSGYGSITDPAGALIDDITREEQ